MATIPKWPGSARELTPWQQIVSEAARMLDPEPVVSSAQLSDAAMESRDGCERSLHRYCREAWHVVEPGVPFVDGWVVGCLCEHLQAMTAGQLLKLVISLPVRHLKSLGAAVFWPTWEWTTQPHVKQIFASYSDAFSYRDSQRCQDVINSPWYQARWGSTYRLRARTMGRITNDRGGHRLAISIKGRGVGEGADRLVGDDLHKPTEAHSKAARDGVIRFWTRTMAGRANDFARCRRLLIHARLDEEDISGYTLAREIGYEQLSLPLRYEPKRYFFDLAQAREANDANPIVPTSLQKARPELQDPRTVEGEVLHPERYDDAGAKEVEREFVAEGVDSQLQQAPSRKRGGMFDARHFRYATIEGNSLKLGRDDRAAGSVAPRVLLSSIVWFQIIDTSFTDDPESSYNVIGTLGSGQIGLAKFLVVWSIFREHLTAPEQWEAIKELGRGEAVWDPESRKFAVAGADRPWPGRLVVRAIEPKATGPGLLAQARIEKVPLVPIEGPEYAGGKELRAVPLAILYQQGTVWHRQGMTGQTAFESEIVAFPKSDKDDQVDVASYAAIMFNTSRLLTAVTSATCSLIEQERLDAAAAGGDGWYEFGGQRVYLGDD